MALDPAALMVAVLDSNTFVPWESNFDGLNPDHDFGNTLESANAKTEQRSILFFSSMMLHSCKVSQQ